jgi:hypothetical protein
MVELAGPSLQALKLSAGFMMSDARRDVGLIFQFLHLEDYDRIGESRGPEVASGWGECVVCGCQ